MSTVDEHALTLPRRRRLLAGLIGAAGALCLPIARVAQGRPTSRSPGPIAASAASDARSAAISAHFPFGPVVPPVLLSPWPFQTHENKLIDSSTLFKGRVTALQLMFTGCSATCPIQGAIFAEAQRQLGSTAGDAQFLSLSIAPDADNPAALREWLKGFDARPGWIAAAPRRSDLVAIRFALRGDYVGGTGAEQRPTDAHTAQVYLIDRQGRLVHRSANFPPVEQIVENLRRLRDLA